MAQMTAAKRAGELIRLPAEARKDALNCMSYEEQAAILLCMPASNRQEVLREMPDDDQTAVLECMQQGMPQVDKQIEPMPQQQPHVSEAMRAEQVSAMQSMRANALRLTLTRYYTKHAPNELAKVENLVARVVGGPPTKVGGMVLGGVMWSEEELFEKVKAKYGAEVTPAQV